MESRLRPPDNEMERKQFQMTAQQEIHSWIFTVTRD